VVKIRPHFNLLLTLVLLVVVLLDFAPLCCEDEDENEHGGTFSITILLHGFRFLVGLGLTAAGERVGACVEPADAVAVGLERRNANVAVGDGDGVADGDRVPLADGDGLGEGLGVGEGITFSHRCSGTLAPPISLTSVSQRA
jgi:hypothetical protein